MSLLSELLPITGGGDSGEITINTLSEQQTAAANQKTFTLKQISFRPGFDDLRVAINGVIQSPESACYTESGTTGITTSEPLKAGDTLAASIIRAEENKADITQYSETQIAAANQTEFTLKQIRYRFGYQDLTVSINGVTQDRTINSYTETSAGTSLIFTEPLKDNDQVMFSIIRFL